MLTEPSTANTAPLSLLFITLYQNKTFILNRCLFFKRRLEKTWHTIYIYCFNLLLLMFSLLCWYDIAARQLRRSRRWQHCAQHSHSLCAEADRWLWRGCELPACAIRQIHIFRQQPSYHQSWQVLSLYCNLWKLAEQAVLLNYFKKGNI